MLDLQNLIAEGKPIYVRNKVGNILREPSPYHLEIRGEGGDKISVIIPAVRYPYLIANVPRELLAKSVDFSKALQTGALVLVDPDKARKEMEDPLAQATIDQALTRFGRDYSAPRAQTALSARAAQPGQAAAMQPRTASDHTADTAQPTDTKMLAKDQDINSRIIQLCMDLESDPELRDDIFLEFNGMEPDSFSAEDLGHIITKCHAHTKITQWAKKLLADMHDVDSAEAEIEAVVQTKKTGSRTSRRRRGPRLDG